MQHYSQWHFAICAKLTPLNWIYFRDNLKKWRYLSEGWQLYGNIYTVRCISVRLRDISQLFSMIWTTLRLTYLRPRANWNILNLRSISLMLLGRSIYIAPGKYPNGSLSSIIGTFHIILIVTDWWLFIN